jgi:hypothetical protein
MSQVGSGPYTLDPQSEHPAAPSSMSAWCFRVATAAFDDGQVIELHAGELFHIPPVPHDSWVVGEDPYVSLHFLGADVYAK